MIQRYNVERLLRLSSEADDLLHLINHRHLHRGGYAHVIMQDELILSMRVLGMTTVYQIAKPFLDEGEITKPIGA